MTHQNEILISDIFNSDKIKHSAVRISKRTGHALIWILLRNYLVSIHFINKKSKEIWVKIKNGLHRNYQEKLKENKEVSKYIKIISEYQQKIRKMKHKIKEEEGIE